MKKDILLIVATHGNEKIGIEVIKTLRSMGLEKYFDYLIANPRALKIDKRFVDFDLNRAYPGKKYSRFYEKRRAYKILSFVRQYKYIIDLHEASAGNDDFIIIPREKISRAFPVDLIAMKKVLLWPDPKGPLGQIIAKVIELEFGTRKRNRRRVVAKAARIVESFLRLAGDRKKNSSFAQKEIYRVYGKLRSDELRAQEDAGLTDFKLAQVNGEKFYPLLVGQYARDGIICYKMRKEG